MIAATHNKTADSRVNRLKTVAGKKFSSVFENPPSRLQQISTQNQPSAAKTNRRAVSHEISIDLHTISTELDNMATNTSESRKMSGRGAVGNTKIDVENSKFEHGFCLTETRSGMDRGEVEQHGQMKTHIGDRAVRNLTRGGE